MRTGEFLHSFEGGFVEAQLEVECFCYGFVGDVVVAVRESETKLVSWLVGWLVGWCRCRCRAGCTHVGPIPPLVTTKS